MFHLAARRGERSAGAKGPTKGRERRAPPGKEKKERGKTGIDRARESKVTNTKVIVLLSPTRPSEFIGYRATTRSLFHALKEEEQQQRGR